MRYALSGLAAGLLFAACSPTSTEAPAAQAVAETAAADEARAPAPSFVVRFEDTHPLGRAQALEAAGRCEEAAHAARTSIAESPALAGLCFERFTAGGAETVLVACTPPTGDVAAFQDQWITRLRAMDGVDYADINVTFEIVECAAPR